MLKALAALVAVVAALAAVSVIAQSRFRPARYQSGALPPPVSPTVVGGGQVFLEATVAKSGRVTAIKSLRATPPFTSQLTTIVQGWQFRPAERLIDPLPADSRAPEWQPAEASVLVASVVRPPAVNMPTQGEPPKDVGAASDETPVPTNVVVPPFPPTARDGGTVLVEVLVGPAGSPAEARVAAASPPSPGPGGLDQAAIAAARAWSFRPAKVAGAVVSSYAYLIFVFRPPVVTPNPDGSR